MITSLSKLLGVKSITSEFEGYRAKELDIHAAKIARRNANLKIKLPATNHTQNANNTYVKCEAFFRLIQNTKSLQHQGANTAKQHNSIVSVFAMSLNTQHRAVLGALLLLLILLYYSRRQHRNRV